MEDVEMPSTQQTPDTSRIRIPPDLNKHLDEFFSSLKLRILEKAVQHASARTSCEQIGTLHAGDVVAISPGVLADAAIRLNEAFSQRESVHVRRAS
jgi:hypothetical protein